MTLGNATPVKRLPQSYRPPGTIVAIARRYAKRPGPRPQNSGFESSSDVRV